MQTSATVYKRKEKLVHRGVAKLAYAYDLESYVLDVWVQLPPPRPISAIVEMDRLTRHIDVLKLIE